MYQVVIGEHAYRHYIKNFSKKYKQSWDTTQKAIEFSVARLEAALQTDKAETIIDSHPYLVIKFYFPVHGTKKSAKQSGCRAIILANTENRRAEILLIYHKSDLKAGNETVEWKSLVAKNYPDYSGIIK